MFIHSWSYFISLRFQYKIQSTLHSTKLIDTKCDNIFLWPYLWTNMPINPTDVHMDLTFIEKLNEINQIEIIRISNKQWQSRCWPGKEYLTTSIERLIIFVAFFKT